MGMKSGRGACHPGRTAIILIRARATRVRRRDTGCMIVTGTGHGTAASPPAMTALPLRRRIVATARQYLSNVPSSSWREARFDVIAIEGSGDDAELRHFPAAFDAKGKVL